MAHSAPQRYSVLSGLLAAHRVHLASDGAEALRAIRDRLFHLVFLDPSLGSGRDAEGVVQALLELPVPPPVLLPGEDTPATRALAGRLPRTHLFPPDRIQPGSATHGRLRTLFSTGTWVHWDSIRRTL